MEVIPVCNCCKMATTSSSSTIYCNSKRSVLSMIERLGGKQPMFVEGDIRNEALMTEILHDHAIDTVIHFAGLKAVGESIGQTLEYYDNNVNGTLRLISAMRLLP